MPQMLHSQKRTCRSNHKNWLQGGRSSLWNNAMKLLYTACLFASYSYLYSLFDGLVVNEHKVTATTGTGNLVAFYFIPVFVNGLLYMR